MLAKSGRWSRTAAYFICFLGGAWSLAFPSVIVEDKATPWFIAIWTWALVITSLVCVIGSIRENVYFELVAIPLFSATIWVFIAILIAVVWNDDNRPLLFYAAPMAAYIVGGLWPRWAYLKTLTVSAGSGESK